MHNRKKKHVLAQPSRAIVLSSVALTSDTTVYFDVY
jgi:hypothetical protein